MNIAYIIIIVGSTIAALVVLYYYYSYFREEIIIFDELDESHHREIMRYVVTDDPPKGDYSLQFTFRPADLGKTYYLMIGSTPGLGTLNIKYQNGYVRFNKNADDSEFRTVKLANPLSMNKIKVTVKDEKINFFVNGTKTGEDITPQEPFRRPTKYEFGGGSEINRELYFVGVMKGIYVNGRYIDPSNEDVLIVDN